MAYAGGIGQEIDQLKDLSVQELVRRQNLDPSLIYTIALQEKEKMNAAGARQGVLDEPKPEGTVTSQMEQNLASRLAPGIMQQGQRSMQQPQPQPQPQQRPQMARGPQMAQGISGVPANNMGAIGRARGGIIEYAEGGFLSTAKDFDTKLNQAHDRRQTERLARGKSLSDYSPLDPYNSLSNMMYDTGIAGALQGLTGYESEVQQPEEQLRGDLAPVEAFQARLKELNEAKANAFPQEKAMFQQQIQDLLDNTPALIKNAVGGAGMARGGVVGYRDGGEIDMDALLDALMMAESGGDPTRVGDAGEEGAFQIRPSTAADPGFGVPPMKGDRFDLEDSRNFARQYLQAMIDRYDGDVEAGLIAYNAGFGNADKFIAANRDYDVLPQTNTTQPYVRKIMGEVEKEDRRRDFRMGGGRSISTTADESYTERTRRERLGRQEEMANRQQALGAFLQGEETEEAEMYEPNLPDALTVAQAMESLSGGAEEVPVIAGFPTREETDKAFTGAGLSGYGDGSRIRQRARTGPEEAVEEESRELTLGGGGRNITTTLPESFTERNTRERREANAPAEGIAGYLQNIGRQQQLRRDDFRRAVPGAEAAVARAEQEKEDGGIGYLRRLGRLQERAAQRQAEEEERAAKFMAMLQQNEDMVADIDPAGKGTGQAYTQQTMPIREFQSGGGVKRFNGEDGSLVEGEMTEAEKLQAQLIALDEESISDLESAVLTREEREERERSRRERMGEIVTADVKGLANAAFNLPANVVGTAYNALTQPNAVTRAMQKAAEASGITDFLRGTGIPNIPTPAPSGNTLTRNSNARTGPKTQLEYFQELARKQEEAGTVEASRARRRAEEERRRNQPKTGIAGALDKAKPLGGLALRLAEVLGRGAGASKGFEGAKILEESSRLRSEEAKMQLARDQMAATTAQSRGRSTATANTALLKLITEYRDGSAYRIDLAAKAEELNLEETDPKVIKAVMDAYIDNLKNVQGMLGGGIGSMQGLGGGGGGLPEGVTVKRVN